MEAVTCVNLVGPPALFISVVVVIGCFPIGVEHGLLGESMTEGKLHSGGQVAMGSLVALTIDDGRQGGGLGGDARPQGTLHT